VAQRRREFGIRAALGASARAIVLQVVRGGLRVVVLGIAAGTIIAVVAGGFLRRMLFRTAPTDPLVLGAVAGLLLLVTLVGSLIPAWRAARVSPMEAVRNESAGRLRLPRSRAPRFGILPRGGQSSSWTCSSGALVPAGSHWTR
jgi:predicted lysophospholipase L1 biosynthesis ABC-type transport system permease subunit